MCVCVCVCGEGGGVYLDADHGEVGPHHRVKIVEDVRLTQCVLGLSQVTELQREGDTNRKCFLVSV